MFQSFGSCDVSCQVCLGRPPDLLPSIFPSISCSCVELCIIRCPRYCNFLVLNCLTISLPVPILLNTSSLVMFSVHDISITLRYTHISKASSLDNRDLVVVHVSAPLNSVGHMLLSVKLQSMQHNTYVPFAFCRTGSAASALHDVLRPDGTAPLFVDPN